MARGGGVDSTEGLDGEFTTDSMEHVVSSVFLKVSAGMSYKLHSQTPAT